jgi:hypothetical protein
MKNICCALLALVCVAVSNISLADGGTRADSHAPIGVMAEHYHKKGEWMLSYRFMSMSMEGNSSGTSSISSDEIVTTVPNRFFGNPGQPPTLRVVPDEMSMDMHMIGMMYAPSDNVTLMLMLNYLSKDMDHTTYQGGVGTTVLGTFNTKTSGWGDTSIAAMISLINRPESKMHLIAGVSLPTGSTDETGQVLTPMNMQPTVRLPYPMQLGSGTYDPIIGASYSGFGNSFAWGGQWRSTFRVTDNDDNYQLGDEHRLTGWLSYLWSDPVSTSLRLEYLNRDNISGIDPLIMLPVQTAEPNRQGGSRTDLSFGVNLAGQNSLHGWRLALEYSIPVHQDLDGPQLEVDSQWVVGLQKSF